MNMGLPTHILKTIHLDSRSGKEVHFICKSDWLFDVARIKMDRVQGKLKTKQHEVDDKTDNSIFGSLK